MRELIKMYTNCRINKKQMQNSVTPRLVFTGVVGAHVPTRDKTTWSRLDQRVAGGFVEGVAKDLSSVDTCQLIDCFRSIDMRYPP